jgi:hypothetical protein
VAVVMWDMIVNVCLEILRKEGFKIICPRTLAYWQKATCEFQLFVFIPLLSVFLFKEEEIFYSESFFFYSIVQNGS